MQATLQFKHYKVLEIVYRSDLNGEVGETLQPEFSVELLLQEDEPKKAMIKLGVVLSDESSNFVKVVVAGFFSIDSEENLTEEEIKQLYSLNGVAILFPYLRSLVSDVTSKSDSSPIILPTINIHKLLKDEQEER